MASRLTSLYQTLKQCIVSIEGIKIKRNKKKMELFGPLHNIEEPEERRLSYGSGMVIHPTGYILTCHHVISGMSLVKVKIGNEKELYQAKLVWSNPKKDIAIIKIISTKKLHSVRFGSSTQTPIGERVFAIGNPFGFDHTLTIGVLGGKNRSLDTENLEYPVLLQTDAALNPGNSGGPLFNSKGYVIGMNAIIIPSYQNMGFAVPVEEFLPEIKRFVANRDEFKNH
jgi:serine protease Do